ncbi:MAG: adenylate/guanylate cyclase domain-containing protein [Oceanococcus sp.]
MSIKMCVSCTAENATDAKFCNQCGSALFDKSENAPSRRSMYTPKHLVDRVLQHRSAMQGERKQVTVFFADMAGSTKLAEQVDPEQWHLILDEFFSILSGEIHRFEGTVNQYTGDGIMALFGAPLALEDHAQRAAHAALSLRGRLRSFADRLRLEQGINLSTRMGMNSGEVIVGSIGDDLRMDYTAQGLTVNLAARMEQIAQPGCVYLTRNTAQLIDDYFQLERLGPMAIKGSSEPVEVFELNGQSDISLRLDAARKRGLSGFCGRDDELARLKQIQQDSVAGSRQVCVVVGDAGLGKSRLCYEAAQIWQQQGVPVLAASGVPHGQAVPMQPIRSLILQRFGVAPQDPAAVARQKIAGGLLLLDESLRGQLNLIFEFLGIAVEGVSSDVPPEAREHRVREVFKQICLMDPQQTHVIQIDDLHWLDPGSVEFLQIMLECSECTSSLLLFNMRPGPLPDWLAQHKPHVVALQPLNERAIYKLCSGLLGHAAGMPELAARLASHAAGNPFFVEEAVRALAAQAHLLGEPGQYALTQDMDALTIPATVQSTIAARVDILGNAEKDLLQIAAVLGLSGETRLLAAICDEQPAHFENSLATLCTGHYLEHDEQQQGRWRFAHPLVQEVIYSSLLSERRLSLHRRIAQLLERHVLSDPCVGARLMLAQHWAAVGERVSAARWAFEAGNELAHENAAESVRVMQQVIDWLHPLPDVQEARLMAVQARAAVVRSATFFQLPDASVSQYYDEARAMAELIGDKNLLAELLISNGVRLLNIAHADRAVENTSEAMALAQEVAREGGDDSLESRFRIPILFSYFGAGRLREGLQVLDQRDGGAWHQGEMDEDNMLSRGFRGLMLAAMGQLELAEQESRRAIACSHAHGRKVSWLLANTVEIQLQRGNFQDADELSTQALADARDFGSPLFEEVALRATAHTRIAQGRAAEAVEILKRSRMLVAPGAVATQFRAAHLASLALALLADGQLEDALAEAKQAVAIGEQARQRLLTIQALLALAETQLALGQRVSDALAQAEVLIQETGARVYRGNILEIRAQDAACQKQTAKSQEYLQQAAELWQEMGAPARAEKLLQANAA